jgi:hypothetical protein
MRDKSSVQTEREELEIAVIADYIDDRPVWIGILDVLYNSKVPLTLDRIKKRLEGKEPCEGEGRILYEEGVTYSKSHIQRVLERLASMKVIASIKVDGFRGKRWYITDRGKKVYERVLKETRSSEK